MQKLAKLAKFKNFKKIDFVPKNLPKKIWKKFIFLFLEKMHSFPQNIENSAHFKHFWPKYGVNMLKLAKFRNLKKIDFLEIFLFFF